MLELNVLQKVLIASTILSTFSCIFVQKTKKYFKSSTYLMIYSLIVNIFLGVLFCNSFTSIKFPDNLWVGFFSFLGADTIYKSLEGKLLSHRNIGSKKH